MRAAAHQRSAVRHLLALVAIGLSWLCLLLAAISLTTIVLLVRLGPDGGMGGPSTTLYSQAGVDAYLDPSDGLPGISIRWRGGVSPTTQPVAVNRYLLQNGLGLPTFRISDQKLPVRTPAGVVTYNFRVWQIQTNLLLLAVPLFLSASLIVSWSRGSVNGVTVAAMRMASDLWMPLGRRLGLIERPDRGFPVELREPPRRDPP